MLRFLNAALTLILALFFSLLGIFIFLVALIPSIQDNFVSLIHHHFWLWFFFGVCFFLIGLAFFAYTFLGCRKTYLSSKTGANLTIISEDVIHSYLQTYFEKLFPKQQIPYRLLLKKGKIQIIADLPYVPLEEQKNILSLIENDLSELLNQTFGYKQTLELSLSFEK